MNVAAKLQADREGFARAQEHFGMMEKRLKSREMSQWTHDQVESYLTEQGRELQRLLLQAHLDLRAAREQRVPLAPQDGQARPRVRPSMRALLTLLGRVEVSRLAYQGDGVEGLRPADGVLNLPDELYSYNLQRLIADAAARNSFDEVVEMLERQTGAPVAKRQVEEVAVRSAQDFEAFYADMRQRGTIRETTEDLLVITTDAKGIVVRPQDLRPATKKAAEKASQKLSTRLSPGEKRNRKRMAQVAAVYTVARWVRTHDDVMHGLVPHKEKAAARPKVENKRVWASVTHAASVVIDEAFQEALARDPKKERTWVVLVDGNEDQLSRVKKKAKQHGVKVTIVLDLIHVLEWLWRAANAMHGKESAAGEAWVTERLSWLLEGCGGRVLAADIMCSLRQGEWSMGQGMALEHVATYLRNHHAYMKYDAYIAQGMPIATGVIEGACRYLVKDRMDRTGARWSLAGAEAVLRLRALVTSGDMEAYWTFHLANEHQRNHATRYLDGKVPNPIPGPLKLAKP